MKKMGLGKKTLKGDAMDHLHRCYWCRIRRGAIEKDLAATIAKRTESSLMLQLILHLSVKHRRCAIGGKK